MLQARAHSGDASRYRGFAVKGLRVLGLGAALLALPGGSAVANDGQGEHGDKASKRTHCETPEPLAVLFIGNSYMIMNQLPDLVAALGEHAGVELRTELLAMGGKNFEYHLESRKTAKKLAEREWDYVILQSHSLDTLRNRKGFLAAGQALVERVRKAGAEPLLFETWARKADASIYRFGKYGYTPGEMQAKVRDGYAELSRRTGAEVIEVGEAWMAASARAPEIDLYASDNNHPGKPGSYLAANVVFAALTDLNPVDNVMPLLDLDAAQSRVLQKQAAAIIQPECASF